MSTCVICYRRKVITVNDKDCCGSVTCVGLITASGTIAPDLDAFEEQALEEGGRLGGTYLDELQSYDLSLLTKDQWLTFLRTVLGGYSQELRAQVAENKAPF